MRIFIIDQGGGRYDHAPALEHGEIVYMFSTCARWVMQPSAFLRAVAGRMRELEFDPDVDAIALSGDVRLVSVLAAFVAGRADKMNVLIYDAKTSRYELRHVEFNAAAPL